MLAIEHASDKLGGFWLSRIYDGHPIHVALFIFAIDFGIINILMWWPEGRWNREHFASFWVGDSILLPAAAGLAAWALLHANVPPGWYTSTRWHAILLVGGITASIVMEIMAMAGDTFNWRQEVSPSKLYHTLIFGFMVYWIGVVIVPLWAAYLSRPQSRPLALAAAVVTALALNHLYLGAFRDSKVVVTDQHLEAHYRFPDVWNSEFTVRK